MEEINKPTLENINQSIYELCGWTFGKKGAEDFIHFLDEIYHLIVENYLIADENAIGNNEEIINTIYKVREMKDRITFAIDNEKKEHTR